MGIKQFFRWLKRLGQRKALEKEVVELRLMVMTLMATQQELAQDLLAMVDRVKKIQGESQATRAQVDVLTATVEELKKAIELGAVTPEVTAAFEAVKVELEALDNIVPDATEPTGN